MERITVIRMLTAGKTRKVAGNTKDKKNAQGSLESFPIYSELGFRKLLFNANSL